MTASSGDFCCSIIHEKQNNEVEKIINGALIYYRNQICYFKQYVKNKKCFVSINVRTNLNSNTKKSKFCISVVSIFQKIIALPVVLFTSELHFED